jgi:hypothetical protein
MWVRPKGKYDDKIVMNFISHHFIKPLFDMLDENKFKYQAVKNECVRQWQENTIDTETLEKCIVTAKHILKLVAQEIDQERKTETYIK